MMRSPILKDPCEAARPSFSISDIKIPVAFPPMTFIPKNVFEDGFLTVTDRGSSAGQSPCAIVSSLKVQKPTFELS